MRMIVAFEHVSHEPPRKHVVLLYSTFSFVFESNHRTLLRLIQLIRNMWYLALEKNTARNCHGQFCNSILLKFQCQLFSACAHKPTQMTLCHWGNSIKTAPQNMSHQTCVSSDTLQILTLSHFLLHIAIKIGYTHMHMHVRVCTLLVVKFPRFEPSTFYWHRNLVVHIAVVGVQQTLFGKFNPFSVRVRLTSSAEMSTYIDTHHNEKVLKRDVYEPTVVCQSRKNRIVHTFPLLPNFRKNASAINVQIWRMWCNLFERSPPELIARVLDGIKTRYFCDKCVLFYAVRSHSRIMFRQFFFL